MRRHEIIRSGSLIFTCTECDGHFGIKDVYEGRFHPSTNVCTACYERGVRQDSTIWCFGKPAIKNQKGKLIQIGYDPQAPECTFECPDRHICRIYAHGKGKRHVKKA